jgi:membrane fusion protein
LSSLFRTQARDARLLSQQQAAPWVLPRLQVWVGVVVAWLVLAGAVIAQLGYAEKISVQGTVQSQRKPIVVRATQSSVVAQLFVAEQAIIQRGAPLLLLDARSFATTHASHDTLHVEQLQTQHAALLQRKNHEQKRFVHKQTAIQQQLAGLGEQLGTLAQRITLLRQRLTLADEDSSRLASLAAQHWVSIRDVQQAQTVQLVAQETLLAQIAQQQALQLRVSDLQGQLQLLASEAESRGADTSAQIRQLEHQIKRVGVQGQTTVVSATSGRVVDLLVQTGQQVIAGMPLLSVLPLTPEAHAVEAYLSSKAAGQVRAGMSAQLRYAGYPFQEYGSAKGKVVDVSAVNLADTSRPAYRAQIEVVEVPANVDFVPAGMLVEVDIALREQALWRWLWQPITAILKRL